MRRQQGSDGFNKEKFVFLIASFIFAAGTYEFLSTGPVQLTVGSPISTQPGPAPLRNTNAEQPAAENFYVVTGSKTRMVDPLTNQLVNRDRKSPFTRADWVSAKPIVADKGPKNPPPPPPPPPPPVDTKIADEGKTKKRFAGEDAQAEVEFVGVMIMSGQTYGMIKPKDGGAPAKVKVGDKIPDYNYVVTKIDKQAIWIEDENKRPFLLKDSQFIPADGTSTKGDGVEDEDPDMKPKKKGTGEKTTEKKGKTEDHKAAEKKPAATAKQAAENKPEPAKATAPADFKPATPIIAAAYEKLKKEIAEEKDEAKKAKLQTKLEALMKHNTQTEQAHNTPRPAPAPKAPAPAPKAPAATPKK